MNTNITAESSRLDVSDTRAEELKVAYAKVFRRIIPLLVAGYIVAYLDRVNVGFAKLQMLEDLRFSETIYGLGAGIFFIGYFLFEIPSNIILHRVGARLWIARSEERRVGKECRSRWRPDH